MRWKTFDFCGQHCREKFLAASEASKPDDKSIDCCCGSTPMKHMLMMVVGCGLALLLIFLLPAMGLGSGWVLIVAFGAMMLCHLMHFGMHKDEEKGEDDHEHQH